jgi:hypothetical protein
MSIYINLQPAGPTSILPSAVYLILNMSKRIFYPLFLLLIPFIGMMLTDEINWSVFDFIIMGIFLLLLGIGIDAISRKTENKKNRILYSALLIFVFLLIWAELAVGIFGSPLAGS